MVLVEGGGVAAGLSCMTHLELTFNLLGKNEYSLAHATVRIADKSRSLE